MRISTLKKRAEFQRVRGGGRSGTPAFVLEGKMRPDGSAEGPRFGFTVTKKLGNAVARNRIRRRLKSAIVELSTAHADARFDYVVVARDAALAMPFTTLLAELEKAFRLVGQGTGRETPKPRRGAEQRGRPSKSGQTGKDHAR